MNNEGQGPIDTNGLNSDGPGELGRAFGSEESGAGAPRRAEVPASSEAPSTSAEQLAAQLADAQRALRESETQRRLANNALALQERLREAAEAGEARAREEVERERKARQTADEDLRAERRMARQQEAQAKEELKQAQLNAETEKKALEAKLEEERKAAADAAKKAADVLRAEQEKARQAQQDAADEKRKLEEKHAENIRVLRQRAAQTIQEEQNARQQAERVAAAQQVTLQQLAAELSAAQQQQAAPQPTPQQAPQPSPAVARTAQAEHSKRITQILQMTPGAQRTMAWSRFNDGLTNLTLQGGNVGLAITLVGGVLAMVNGRDIREMATAATVTGAAYVTSALLRYVPPIAFNRLLRSEQEHAAKLEAKERETQQKLENLYQQQPGWMRTQTWGKIANIVNMPFRVLAPASLAFYILTAEKVHQALEFTGFLKDFSVELINNTAYTFFNITGAQVESGIQNAHSAALPLTIALVTGYGITKLMEGASKEKVIRMKRKAERQLLS